jgi:hypothetical protein
MGSSSTSRLTPLIRWLGLTLVVVMILQMVGLLSASDWSDVDYQRRFSQTLMVLSPMAFTGLLLMLISSRLDYPGKAQLPIRWVVCGFSSLLAIALISSIHIVMTTNQFVAGKHDQALLQLRNQLENARQEAQDPEKQKIYGDQLAQAGLLPAGATDEQEQKAAKVAMERQLTEMDQQINQRERVRNGVVNEGLFAGLFGVVVFSVGFVLLALTAVL